VLTRLVQVREDERSCGRKSGEPHEDRSEDVVARGRPVERGQRHDNHVERRRRRSRLCEQVRHGRPEVRAAVGSPREPRPPQRVRIDENRSVAARTQHGRELRGAEVGEVRIVDEVARHRHRRIHDEDTQHERRA